MFKTKSVDSILKAFNTAITDLDALVNKSADEHEDITDEQLRLEARKTELETEMARAAAVRVKLQDLISN